MKRRQLLVAPVGLFITFLGILWFLQGAAIIHPCPVLCVSNCECVTGGSQFWEAAGAIALIVGVTIIVLVMRRARML